jgi:hypothetical protein
MTSSVVSQSSLAMAGEQAVLLHLKACKHLRMKAIRETASPEPTTTTTTTLDLVPAKETIEINDTISIDATTNTEPEPQPEPEPKEPQKDPKHFILEVEDRLRAPLRKVAPKVLPAKGDLNRRLGLKEKEESVLVPVPIEVDRENIIRDIRNALPPESKRPRRLARAPDQNATWRKPDYVFPGPLPAESPKHHWRLPSKVDKKLLKHARPASSALKKKTLEQTFCPIIITITKAPTAPPPPVLAQPTKPFRGLFRL